MPLDLGPLLSQLYIQDKSLRRMQIPYNPSTREVGGEFAWSQTPLVRAVERQYNAGLPCRIICLKARQLGMCLAPESRVLTADLRWVRIDSLQPGDQVVAVDEGSDGRRARRLRTGIVEATRRVYEQAYRLVLDNGETIVATAGHRFLFHQRGGTLAQWRPVSFMRPGDEIRFVTSTWSEGGYEDGWFGGLADGEGSLSLSSRAGINLSVSQRPGDVLDRATEYLKSRGYSFRFEIDDRKGGESSKFGQGPVVKVVVSRIDEMFRLLGQTRPSRFIRQWWEGKELPGKRSGVGWTKILSITPLGPREMIDLQTSTKTFITEGLVSHNSTITSAIMYLWGFINPGSEALILAQESDTSEALFQKSKVFWENWPFRHAFNLKYSTKYYMHWLETGSKMKIATAGNRLSGRGHTFHAVHLSEAAFYIDPKTLLLGLRQSVPDLHGTIVLLESTANGMNYYKEMWDEAVSGESDYIPLFFPWWRHPEYQMATTLSSPLELNNDERDLLRQMRSAYYSDEWIYSHLHWRRWAIRGNKVNDIDSFMQEYPATPEEAFRATGTPVFPHDKVHAAFHDRSSCICNGGQRGYLIENVSTGRIQFSPDRSGPIRIFKHPSRTDTNPMRYFIGADPSETTYGDLCCAQVINRATNEQVAVLHGRYDPRQFGHEIMRLGYYYNGCMVCPEAEGGGQACIATILERNYPLVWMHQWADKSPGKKSTSYGWAMNFSRKKWCVGYTQNLFNTDDIVIHDETTYKQILDYSHWGPGEDMSNATEGGHDDAVTALCISLTASHLEGPYLPDQFRRSHPVLDIYDPDVNAAL